MKILIIDDSKSICDLIKFTLADFTEVTTRTASNGQEAINILQNESFNLILSDINMPIMNGIQFTTQCRNILKINTPIIILSTESDHKAKLKGKQAGANGWIVKPFRPDSFIKTLAKFIELK